MNNLAHDFPSISAEKMRELTTMEPLFGLDNVSFSVPGRMLLEPLTMTLPARRISG